jgi:hypothetical protein
MTTYTIIESNSGLVWGTAIADTIIDACRMIDADFGDHDFAYEDVGRSVIHSGQDHYVVYADNTGIDYMADDYEAVRALPVAGYVTRSLNNF